MDCWLSALLRSRNIAPLDNLMSSILFGHDDRGGAMALTLALEIHALRSTPAK